MKTLSREIKFRAFDKKDNKMSDNFELHERQIMCGEEYMADTYDIDCGDFEVMQYTGLHDKNGKEIYEGDIITCEGGYEGEDCEQPSKVYFCSESLQWRVACLCGCQSYELSDYDYASVIGNIYQNPELLPNNK